MPTCATVVRHIPLEVLSNIMNLQECGVLHRAARGGRSLVFTRSYPAYSYATSGLHVRRDERQQMAQPEAEAGSGAGEAEYRNAREARNEDGVGETHPARATLCVIWRSR